MNMATISASGLPHKEIGKIGTRAAWVSAACAPTLIACVQK
jgi:hypothetical protein